MNKKINKIFIFLKNIPWLLLAWPESCVFEDSLVEDDEFLCSNEDVLKHNQTINNYIYAWLNKPMIEIQIRVNNHIIQNGKKVSAHITDVVHFAFDFFKCI